MNISDVSKKINVTANTLRYYEQEHLIPQIKRDANGYRDYTEYDLNWIYFVKCMRDAGMSVVAIAKYTQLFLNDRHGTFEQRKEILIAEREKLEHKLTKIENSLEFINHKIDTYNGKFQIAENKIDPYIQKKLNQTKGDAENENCSI